MGDLRISGGEIATADGRVIGEHAGLHRYTIGQRRGIGVAASEPLYVLKIDVPRNQLVVGKRSELYGKSLTASGVNWVAIDNPDEPVRANVRIRYRANEAPAAIAPIETNRVRVEFDEPQPAISPGQAAVFYDGDVLVGGGWIE
jgi:tRNA-specific 2-thiouridylase